MCPPFVFGGKMASSKEYLDFILDQLSGSDGVAYRPMMGEYILCLNGRIFGGVYDDRLLVKITPASLALLPDAIREEPYPGAKQMLLVGEVDNREFLSRLLDAMYPELPAPKPKKPRAQKTVIE